MARKPAPAGNRFKRRTELSPFGRRLRDLLAASPFRTRREFLQAANVSHGTVYAYETTDRAPTPAHLRAMSDALGVSPVALLGLTDETPSNLMLADRDWAARLRAMWRPAMALYGESIRGALNDPTQPLPLEAIERFVALVLQIDHVRFALEARQDLARLESTPETARRTLLASIRAKVTMLGEDMYVHATQLHYALRSWGKLGILDGIVDAASAWSATASGRSETAAPPSREPE